MEAKVSKIFIDCDEAKHICDKSQYNESSWWERFRLNLRLIYCKVTRSYVKKNQKLTDLVTDPEVECMDNSIKSKMKLELERELQNHQ